MAAELMTEEVKTVGSRIDVGDSCGEEGPPEIIDDHCEDSVEAIDREVNGPKHRLFDMGVLLRARGSASDDTKAVMGQIRSRGAWRTLVQVPDDYVEACERLSRVFPNFRELVDDHLVPQLALSRMSSQRRFGLTPILLLGPPGIGKSSFCGDLATAFALPVQRINLESAQAGFEITGVARGWSSAGPGRLLRWLAGDIPVNGLFVLEELDKAGGDPRYDPKAPLLQLLEETTARAFCDQSMPEVDFDVTPVSFIFTANSLEGMSAPLLDRMTVLEVPAMTPDQAREAARRQYARLLEQFEFSDPPPVLADEALDVLSLESPRRQRQLLRLALGRAVAEGASALSIRSAQRVHGRRLGFI
jgi:ATP-dependent Lon protease